MICCLDLKQLRRILCRRDFTIHDMAEELGRSAGWVCEVEKGKWPLINTRKWAEALCKNARGSLTTERTIDLVTAAVIEAAKISREKRLAEERGLDYFLP